MTALLLRSLAGLAFLAAAMALAVLGPAADRADWRGWAFLAVFLGAALAVTVWLAVAAPDLLARRVAAGPVAEPSPRQRLIQSAASLAFLALLVVPGLDRRLGWSAVPPWLSVAGDALVGLAFLGVARVFRENHHAAAVVAVAAGQRVIDTGPYARVRHPMYAAAGLLLLATPPALGSWWGLAAAAALLAVIVARLLDEERVLMAQLAGYAEYRRRVRWRLLPGVW